MKFTKEEISLCKQVAEKYRKKIEYGDWFINIKSGDVPFLYQYGCQYSGNFVLWTISDCLEFFKERAIYLESLCRTDECEYMCAISETDDLGLVRGTARSFEGETLLEACLKAVLAVFEEEEK